MPLSKFVTFTLHPHGNADTLSIAKIDGTDWQCVVRTQDWAAGCRGIYIAIDALLDPARPYFAFLQKTATKKFEDGRFGHKIKTIRLRGALSQGLLIPPPEGASDVPAGDLDKFLGIERYEPPIPVDMRGEMIRSPGSFALLPHAENAKNYPTMFADGDPVRVSEKIHGCLIYTTKISMADGSYRKIGDLVTNDATGQEVLGVDKSGKVVATKILRVYNNGRGKEWVKVVGKRRGAGRGNSTFALNCTPDHEVFVDGKYIAAKDLKPGHMVTLLRSELELTPIQKQVLLGKMLGDGSLFSNTDYSKSLIFRHKLDHADYVKWTLRGLGELASDEWRTAVSGYGTSMICSRSTFSGQIKEFLKSFLQSGKKQVPSWVENEIGPIAIAFWYMDDGSLSYQKDQEDRAHFAVCAFNKKSCEVLIRGLAKFGINAVYYEADGYSRLRLNADDAERLFLTVAPYIPPVMQYKLPTRYRGHDGWLPQSETAAYKPTLVKQEIISVSPFKPDHVTRFDLETETHNFFANGVLVHNSSFRAGLVDDGRAEGPIYIVGSHTTAKATDGTNLYSRVARELVSEEKLRAMISDSACKFSRNFILFGEIYGYGVQDLQYGCGKNVQKLRIFDVMIDDRFQPQSVIEKISQSLSLETVPLLYHGPFDKAKIMSLRDGPTTISGATHLREGVVVTADPEETVSIYEADGSLKYQGRKTLKYISDDYLERSGAKDGH